MPRVLCRMLSLQRQGVLPLRCTTRGNTSSIIMHKICMIAHHHSNIPRFLLRQHLRCYSSLDFGPAAQTPLLNNLRFIAQFSVYKGKSALRMSPILPTWRDVQSKTVSTGSYKIIDRKGVLLFEFASIIPDQKTSAGFNMYDWDNKLSVALSPLEMEDLALQVSRLPAGQAHKIVHDPNMGSANQGSVLKTLSVGLPKEGRSVFFTLKQAGGGGTGDSNGISVPLTEAEYRLMIRNAEYLTPYLSGMYHVAMSEVDRAYSSPNPQLWETGDPSL